MLKNILNLSSVKKIKKSKQTLIIGGNGLPPNCVIANTPGRCSICEGVWAPTSGSQGQSFCQLPPSTCCIAILPS